MPMLWIWLVGQEILTAIRGGISEDDGLDIEVNACGP